MSLLEDLEQ